MFNSTSIIFDSLLIIFLILVYICQIVISITIPRINLNCFFVPLNSFINIPLSFVYNCSVIIRTMIFRISFNGLTIITDGLCIFLHIVISNTSWIVQFVYVFFYLFYAIVGFHVISDWFVIISFIVVCQSCLVIVVIRIDVVLFHQWTDLGIAEFEFIIDIA